MSNQEGFKQLVWELMNFIGYDFFIPDPRYFECFEGELQDDEYGNKLY